MPRKSTLSTQIVLDRAFALANENGLDAVTYNGLARELGIRPQSMYRYVSDLKELRAALLTRFLDELTTTIGRKMEGLEPIDALRTYAVTMYDECHANPRYYETFERMHTYEIIPELHEPLLALVELVQNPMAKFKGTTAEAARLTQLFVAVNLGYAQMAMTAFIPTSLADDRAMFIRSIDEFLEKILGTQLCHKRQRKRPISATEEEYQ